MSKIIPRISRGKISTTLALETTLCLKPSEAGPTDPIARPVALLIGYSACSRLSLVLGQLPIAISMKDGKSPVKYFTVVPNAKPGYLSECNHRLQAALTIRSSRLTRRHLERSILRRQRPKLFSIFVFFFRIDKLTCNFAKLCVALRRTEAPTHL